MFQKIDKCSPCFNPTRISFPQTQIPLFPGQLLNFPSYWYTITFFII